MKVRCVMEKEPLGNFDVWVFQPKMLAKTLLGAINVALRQTEHSLASCREGEGINFLNLHFY